MTATGPVAPAPERPDVVLEDVQIPAAGILEALSEGVAVAAGGRLLYANRAFTALIDGLEEPLGHLLGPTTAPTEVDLPGADGDVRRLVVTVDPIDVPGHPGAVVLSARRPTGLLARAVALAERDQLTGLLNRRGFEARVQPTIDAARRSGIPVSLAIMDLDHFKRVNDRCGHPVGDAVLRGVAERLRSVARPGDVLARVGGEEFAWLVPGADAARCGAAADRACAAVAAGPLADDVHMTASVGVSEMTAVDDIEDTYRRADVALYWAKTHGRDMTLVWTPAAAEHLTAAMPWGHLLAVAGVIDGTLGGTCRHSARVAELATSLAAQCDWDARSQGRLHQSGCLHDVGKIAVPRAVLEHPGPLDPFQLRQVRQHPVVGAAMAEGTLDSEQAAWVRHHHERWDGTGYPGGLESAEISEGAQLLALADAFEAMTNERPYSSAMSEDEALAEIERSAGRSFRPDAAELMRRALEWLRPDEG